MKKIYCVIVSVLVCLDVQVFGQGSITGGVLSGDTDETLDVYFLADNTGSMSKEISTVQSQARIMFDQMAATTTSNIRFGVGAYRDFGDDFVFKNFLPLSEEDLSVDVEDDPIIKAMMSWSAKGGGDGPEAQIYALDQIATSFYEQIGWRGNAVKIIVWFGDAEGHDPSGEITEKLAIEALQEAGIKVNAIDVQSLDKTGQATRISEQTGGTYTYYSRQQNQQDAASTIPSEFVSTSSFSVDPELAIAAFSRDDMYSVSFPLSKPGFVDIHASTPTHIPTPTPTPTLTPTPTPSRAVDIPALSLTPTPSRAVDTPTPTLGLAPTPSLVDSIVASVEETFHRG